MLVGLRRLEASALGSAYILDGLLVAFALSLAGCTQATREPHRPEIRILAGPVGGGYRSLTVDLVRAFVSALPDVDFRLVERRHAAPILEQMQLGEADLAIALADVAYRSFVGQSGAPVSAGQIRAVSSLDLAPFHLVAGRDSGIFTLGDLSGHSLSIPALGDESGPLVATLLDEFASDLRSVRVEWHPASVGAARVAAGHVDAMLYPLVYPADAVTTATATGARLLHIDGEPVQRLLRHHAFMQLARIPGGVYPNSTASTRTVGVATVLLCRGDLDEELVYRITRSFFDFLSSDRATLGPLRLMDLERAAATPIPLHPGAARYYRERRLFP